MDHNKIDYSLPFDDRKVDVAEKVIELYRLENNTKKLTRDASKITDLVRLASMHLEENE